MKCSYYCETLQDQIKCQNMLFAKGHYWLNGQEIQYVDSHSPIIYHAYGRDKHLTYSACIDFKDAKRRYSNCIYFRPITLMETE